MRGRDIFGINGFEYASGLLEVEKFLMRNFYCMYAAINSPSFLHNDIFDLEYHYGIF